MGNKAVAILVGAMIVVTFLGLGFWLWSRSVKTTPPVVSEKLSEPAKVAAKALPVQRQSEPETKPGIPGYRVLSDRIEYDDLARSQIETTVFMEEHVTEDNLRLLLGHLYKIAKESGPFKYREHPNYVFVYIHAREGQDWIAMGWETAVSEFDVQIRDELLKTVNDPPIVRFGLKEPERQMLWRDIVRIEDRAHREAEEMYPFPMPTGDPNYTETGEKQQLKKQLDYATEQIEQYQVELAESVGLTMEQLEEIGHEGTKNWWTTPPPR